MFASGDLTMSESTISGNTVVGREYYCRGGGAEIAGGVGIDGSTISGNDAPSAGGAKFGTSLSTSFLVNSTVSGNHAHEPQDAGEQARGDHVHREDHRARLEPAGDDREEQRVRLDESPDHDEQAERTEIDEVLARERAEHALRQLRRILGLGMRASVDFPDPDAPTIASDSPGSSSKEMPLRITFFVGGGTYRMRSTVTRPCGLGSRSLSQFNGEFSSSVLILA